MRIHVLKDLHVASSDAIAQLPTSAAANDSTQQAAPAPNPADTYLLTLAMGSRRTMNQALNAIAGIIQPGATATDLDWSKVGYAEVVRVRSELASKYSPSTANKILASLPSTTYCGRSRAKLEFRRWRLMTFVAHSCPRYSTRGYR